MFWQESRHKSCRKNWCGHSAYLWWRRRPVYLIHIISKSLRYILIPFLMYTQWDIDCLLEISHNCISKENTYLDVYHCCSKATSYLSPILLSPTDCCISALQKETIIGKEKMTYCWARLRYLYPWESSFCICRSDLWYQCFC